MSRPARAVAGALLLLIVSSRAIAEDGFALQTADGDNRLQFNFLLQVQGRFTSDDAPNSVVDTFALRRLRPILQGRVAKHFDFYFTPDFAGGIVSIRDAYVDTHFSTAFRIRVGKGKAPFGLERLMSAQSLTFVERGLPTGVAPDRDVGILAVGDIKGGAVSYAGGVMNGVPDGSSSDLDSNDGKDLVGRIVVRPVSGLALAFAASRGEQGPALPSFKTSSQQTFFQYDHAAVGEGTRRRFSPQATYAYKSVWAFGEYIRSSGTVRRGATAGDIAHEAWEVSGSVVVTGEAASDRGVKPRVNFNPGTHALGALQLVARYQVLTIDRAAVLSGLAAAGSSRDAKAYTIGGNWYLNPFIKWVFNFERTVFDGGANGSRPAENAVLVQHQISF